MRQRRGRPIDDKDELYLVRLLPLGIGDLYVFEEDAREDARKRRAKGEKAYVVPRKPLTARPEHGLLKLNP